MLPEKDLNKNRPWTLIAKFGSIFSDFSYCGHIWRWADLLGHNFKEMSKVDIFNFSNGDQRRWWKIWLKLAQRVGLRLWCLMPLKQYFSYIVARPKGFGWSVKDMKVEESTTDNGCKVIEIAHINIWVKWSKNAMFMTNMTFINELLMMIFTIFL